jgi:hypothetical protein
LHENQAEIHRLAEREHVTPTVEFNIKYISQFGIKVLYLKYFETRCVFNEIISDTSL